MSAAWLQPIPKRNRAPCVLVKDAYEAATSDGLCIQRLRIPVAMTVRLVDARRCSTESSTGPPTSGIQSAVKPSSSNSAAALAASSALPYPSWELHMPTPDRSMRSSFPLINSLTLPSAHGIRPPRRWPCVLRASVRRGAATHCQGRALDGRGLHGSAMIFVAQLWMRRYTQVLQKVKHPGLGFPHTPAVAPVDADANRLCRPKVARYPPVAPRRPPRPAVVRRQPSVTAHAWLSGSRRRSGR